MFSFFIRSARVDPTGYFLEAKTTAPPRSAKSKGSFELSEIQHHRFTFDSSGRFVQDAQS